MENKNIGDYESLENTEDMVDINDTDHKDGIEDVNGLIDIQILNETEKMKVMSS